MATNDVTCTAPTYAFSPLRISTITTTGHVGTTIHLEALFAQIPILEYWDLTDGVLKMEYKGDVRGTSFKDIMLKPKDTKKSFFNQATLVVRREVSPMNWKEINVKLFRNGGIQMTGVRSLEMSTGALRWLVDFIRAQCVKQGVFGAPPVISKEQVQLINTDFSVGAKLRRDVLHTVLSETYRLNSSYESAIYQGVKTKYFYNAQRPKDAQPGLCPCPRLCKGTGDGGTIENCKKITISPFQTGQVIITGARTMDQINEAYEFIKGVFTTHADRVMRKTYTLTGDGDPDVALPPPPPPPPKKSSARSATGWILHPCPRNVIQLT
jgi:TATA-box binding protein (TBP) (component of TFIID and TFIIIB)